jgi:NADPH:quinone reductase-like Zn-dependent oxidoreductase
VPEVAPPALGAKQILVKIRAAPINPTDLLSIRYYQMIKKPEPTNIGSEGVGQIV